MTHNGLTSEAVSQVAVGLAATVASSAVFYGGVIASKIKALRPTARLLTRLDSGLNTLKNAPLQRLMSRLKVMSQEDVGLIFNNLSALGFLAACGYETVGAIASGMARDWKQAAVTLAVTTSVFGANFVAGMLPEEAYRETLLRQGPKAINNSGPKPWFPPAPP